MQSSLDLPQVTLEQVLERIFAFRQITRLDQNLLKSALDSQTKLSRQQYHLLRQVLDGLQKGRLWVGD